MCYAYLMAAANLDLMVEVIEDTYYPTVGQRRCVG
jgi:hypothetical protein